MKRAEVLKIIVISTMSILLCALFFLQVIKQDVNARKILELTRTIVSSNTAPRGRIYDRNGLIIVDNKPLKVIYYQRISGMSEKDELAVTKSLAEMTEIATDKLTERMKKIYWLKLNKILGDSLIKPDEEQLYKERKLTSDNIYELKISRITDAHLANISAQEAYIYHLMTSGYSYDEKIIKNSNISDYEYALIAENLDSLKGVGIRLDWERVYPYGSAFRSILGNIGKIPTEQKEEYLNKGYNIDDVAGISYLEYQYDEYLMGTKNKYVLHANKSYELLEEGKRGNDLVLAIDIKLQQEIEEIVVKNIRSAKNEPNTEYFNKAFVIITDPRTGEILALVGKQVIGNQVYDYSPAVITNSYAMGSVVKGASHIVGYNNGGLKIGEYRNDACIKLRNTPEKCSFMYLGTLDDLGALKHSSNTYQFHTAIKVGGGTYYYDGPLNIDLKAFDKYRTTFKEFGLGVLTGIDLPNEKMGYTGGSENAGSLLDFSIGQYDTYTPIQLSQYINTLANSGTRIKPILVKEIRNRDKVVFVSGREILGTVTTKEEYMARTKEGLKQVLEVGGTAYNYINPMYKAAGKTGTSQTFLDTNNDGKDDTATISNAFVGYAPYDEPTMTIAVITPDVANYKSDYVSPVMKRIISEATNAYFKK